MEPLPGLAPPAFLPTTGAELKALGLDQLDVILVSGDTYIDSPFMGVAVIGRVLQRAGFSVGIIAQPAVDSEIDITRLGEPRLFWGVSGGSVDSLVANRTAANKRRKSDDFTPGGVNDRRPDRAVIAYANLIRRFFRHTRPIVLGGIEASLRRLSHYDYWDNRVRRSLLFDAKADLLVYGLGEKTALALASYLAQGLDFRAIPGLCYPAERCPEGFLELPGHQETASDPEALARMFSLFYQNQDPVTAQGLAQRQDSRFLVHNPPSPLPSPEELDGFHELPFTRSVHPYYQRQGRVVAQETIQFAITSHRGCYGECNFCAIAVHQGRTVVSRSPASILREAQGLTRHPDFKGQITDVGGPTANMYGFECAKKLTQGACRHRRCLTPTICRSLPVNHAPQIRLLAELSRLPGVKRVSVASGLRHDLILADRIQGLPYLKALTARHVSGQLKVAPEHSEAKVLTLMGKPGIEPLLEFKRLFAECSRAAGKEQYLTYYFIAAHPGCAREEMLALAAFCRERLKLIPRQTQIFTPTPSTYSTLMYATGRDPFTGAEIYVEREPAKRETQKYILTGGQVRPSGKKRK